MTPTTRNFDCPSTGSRCKDPRCKRSFCALEQEGANREAEHSAGEESKFRKEAEKVGREWCELKGRTVPRGAQFERAVKHPKVIEEVKRRAAFIAGFLHG